MHSKRLTVNISKCDPSKLKQGDECAKDPHEWFAGKDALFLVNNRKLTHN